MIPNENTSYKERGDDLARSLRRFEYNGLNSSGEKQTAPHLTHTGGPF